jgi:hypothetical protein
LIKAYNRVGQGGNEAYRTEIAHEVMRRQVAGKPGLAEAPPPTPPAAPYCGIVNCE